MKEMTASVKQKASITLRRLDPAEHILTRPLYERCFTEDSPEFVDYYYKNRADRNVIFAAVRDDTSDIISMVHVNPVAVRCRGKNIVLPYMVAVATDERYRRLGLMRALMDMAHASLKESGIPFALLMPANEEYYTGLGYKRAWSWRWEEDVLAPAESREAALLTGKKAADCSDEELAELADTVNDALSKSFEMFSLRSMAYYRDLQRQQTASDGELVIYSAPADVASDEGSGGRRPCFALCKGKEAFPPMMVKILDEENFRRICDGPRIFDSTYISEVV